MMWKIALLLLAALLAVGLGQNVPGGRQNIDVNNLEFQKAVDFAVKEFNRHSNHQHYFALVEVLKAESQVVAGMNYIMTLKLGKTKCFRFTQSKFCPVISDPHEAKIIICTFTVWYREWLNDMRVVGSSC